MRLGISTDLGIRDAKLWAQTMRGLGCRAVVFPLDADAPETEIDAFVRAAEEEDLVIAEVGAWSNPMSPNPQEREKAAEKCRKQLRLADRIGARCCVNILGSMGSVWDGPHPDNLTEDTWKKAVEQYAIPYPQASELRKFHDTEIAAAYGVKWIPSLYLISPDGRVALGTVLSSRMERALEKVAKPKPSEKPLDPRDYEIDEDGALRPRLPR